MYKQRIAALDPAQCVYVDEAGVDDTLDYPYGWSLKGSRCLAERLGHHTKRVSMIAAWCLGQVLAPMTFTGTCDSVVVETWFDKVLLAVLQPGQTVILDNASFHRKARLKAILAPLGCRLLALPTYSPDLNRIEPLWHQLKAHISHNHDPSLSLHAKLNAAFCSV